MIKGEWLYRLIGGASGLLLVAPHLCPALSPIQIVAIIPILYIGAQRNLRWRERLEAGAYMGIAYTMPQLVLLRMPTSINLILLLYLTFLLMIFAWASARLLSASTLIGPFAVGALLVVLDWVNITAVPIWGTAQSFVRPWSRFPMLIAFVSLTGITGIIFFLGTLQALFVNIVLFPRRRAKMLMVAAVVVLVWITANLFARSPQPVGQLKVAALGWASDSPMGNVDTSSPEGFDRLYACHVARAADEGARLVVSPELAFYCGSQGREQWLERFRKVAQRHQVFLVIGYLNDSEQENRFMFMFPEGEVLAEYTKTYLTPFEEYRKGHGCLATIDIDGTQVGGMICQDDNFTRLSRQYGRKPVSVVAVPTLDWSTVKGAHLQSAIYRAIESRYAIVRAAMNGISAVVSPTGEIIAQRDHFSKGPGVVVAEVPVYVHRTLFSILGHWPVLPSSVFLLIYVCLHFVKYSPRKRCAKPVVDGGLDSAEGQCTLKSRRLSD